MPTDHRPAAPHHPARRGGRDRQEHVRLRVRRRDRRHRLRAHVPRRGDVRHRPRHPRHHLPQGAPRQRQGVPHHPRPRGPRRRACRTCSPSSRACPVYASTLARGLLGNKIKEHKLHNNPLLALEPGRRDRHRAVPRHARSGSATRSRTRWASPCGRRSGRSSTPATSSSTTRRSTASCPTSRSSPGSAQEGVALPAVRLDARREPRLHAVGADGRRGLPRDHGAARRAGSSWRPSRATSPASSRSSTPPPTCDRNVAVIGRSMEQNFRIATDLGYLTYDAVADRVQGQDQGPPGRQARHRHDRRPGRADGRPRPDGQPRPPLRRDPAGRHRHRQRQPDPRQRGVRLAHDRQPVQGRRERLLPHDQARPRLRPRQPGRAQADARADQAASTSSRCTASSGCRSSTAAWRSRPASRPENVFIIENGHADRVLRRRLAPGAAARSPAGYVYVDGLSVGDVGDIVLRDRRALANDGMFMIVVTVDKQTGTVVGRPEIVTRGFVHLNEQRPDHGGGRRPRHRVDRDARATTSARSRLLKTQIKDGVSRYLYEQTKRRPMVFPVVVEV